MPKYRSPLANKEEFEKAVQNSSSISDILRYFNLRCAGGNHQQVKIWAERHNIALPKYQPNTDNLVKFTRTDDDLVFCINSSFSNRSSIKKRLVQEYGWKYICMNVECQNPQPIWNGKPLTLQLDHINGVSNDNRLENLRFLCPNCHSQTDTFSGRSCIRNITSSGDG